MSEFESKVSSSESSESETMSCDEFRRELEETISKVDVLLQIVIVPRREIPYFTTLFSLKSPYNPCQKRLPLKSPLRDTVTGLVLCDSHALTSSKL